MKISQALKTAKNQLSSQNIDGFSLDALILLKQATNLSKEQIIFNPELDLEPNQEKTFFELIARRANFEPISHITNQREFFGEVFFVNQDVLDPRPDSESLIETAIEIFPDKLQKLEILELGVGSGCLIITLLKHYPLAAGNAVDISVESLNICKKNAISLAADQRLNLNKSDLFANISTDKKFDLIISNPPYIPSKSIELLQPEVRIYEPRLALDGGLDGLDFYRRIALDAKNFLNENGKIILEIGINQEVEIIEIFAKNNFTHIGSKADLSGITRILSFAK